MQKRFPDRKRTYHHWVGIFLFLVFITQSPLNRNTALDLNKCLILKTRKKQKVRQLTSGYNVNKLRVFRIPVPKIQIPVIEQLKLSKNNVFNLFLSHKRDLDLIKSADRSTEQTKRRMKF